MLETLETLARLGLGLGVCWTSRDLRSRIARRRRRRPSQPPPHQTLSPGASNRTAPAQRRTKTERSPADVLDNPRLTLDKPAEDGFDPYNTGAFNRSTSWEQIGRQRKR